jgi:hypothetical protein
MSDGGGEAQAYQGAQDAFDSVSDFSALHFLAEQAVSRISTATLVRIVKVSNTPGKIAPIGTVDVLPLVNQVDGYGNATKHQVVHKLSYFRYHGGNNAVILDPQVDDIGIAVFADRDVSSVKANQDQANPGSLRRFDMADGLYVGRCLSKDDPEQYLRFFKEDDKQGVQAHDKNGNDVLMNDQGITVTDKSNNKIVMNTDGITITDKSGNKIVMSSTGINLNP